MCDATPNQKKLLSRNEDGTFWTSPGLDWSYWWGNQQKNIDEDYPPWNIAPENRALEKEIPMETTICRGELLVLGRIILPRKKKLTAKQPEMFIPENRIWTNYPPFWLGVFCSALLDPGGL